MEGEGEIRWRGVEIKWRGRGRLGAIELFLSLSLKLHQKLIKHGALYSILHYRTSTVLLICNDMYLLIFTAF